jgi:hypothetical protein
MCVPLSEAMNYALQHLSGINVNGLPAFKNHIAFVPCFERGVPYNRAEFGPSFKPDIAIMSIQDAYEFFEPGRRDGQELSEFISGIAEKTPSGQINWISVLSAIDIRRTDAKWAPFGVFGDQGGQNDSPTNVDLQPNKEQNNSRFATCKINLLCQDFALTPDGQRFHRQLRSHPSGLPMLRRWTLALRPLTTSDSAYRVPPRTLHLKITLKTTYTLRRNTPIRFPSATW